MGLGQAGAARYEYLAIVLAALLPASFYVFGLGLYIDDWGFLWALRSSPDQSWAGLYRTLAEQPPLAVRPLQIAWLVTFHKLAPGAILAPHLANQALFAAAGVLLLAMLRRTRNLNGCAFALVLVYLSMPTYMTARFWLANHQSGLGLLCFALALFFIQRWITGNARYANLAAAGAAALACILAYELFLLPLGVAPVLLSLANGGIPRKVLCDRKVIVAYVVIAAALAGGVLFKFSVGYGADPALSPLDWVGETGWLYARAAVTTFWTHGIAAPYFAVRIAAGPYGSLFGPLAAALVVAVVLLRRDARTEAIATIPATGLFAAGLLVFVLGYVPFLTNFWFGGSPFGTANRAHIAGAMGAAMMFVAALSRLFARRPGWAQAALLALCAAGIVTQVTIGRMWGAAWDKANYLVSEIEQRAAPLPAGGTLLLYGHCPYYGAVPVFPPDSWFHKRIEMEAGVHDLGGNTVVPGTRPVAGGIEVRDSNHVGDLPPGGVYSYSDMVIYDLRNHRRHSIATRGDAEAFFAAHPASQATGCSYRGQAGLPLL